MRRVVIGLGSNLGDRAATIAAAIDLFRSDPDVRVLATSALYETPPAGGPPQGDYMNAALLLESSLPGREILRRALEIERALGRVRTPDVRWGPRTIDLDVLWIDGEIITEPGLEVPHPGLKDRAFALRPLLDVAPDAIDPHTGAPLSSFHAARESIRRVSDSIA